MDNDLSRNSPPKFGTFLGVYTPSVLTILGLTMYLRFGWVVGNLGLLLTLLVVVMASSITFLTGLSASAISTNMKVGVGGEYYMIARSLGLELGGAIGIPLYLCRTLSITFYSFGLAESVLIFWPQNWGEMPTYAIQLLTAIIIVLITFLSGKSASLALKVQIPIMIAVGLSILALIIGVLSKGFQAPHLNATYITTNKGFWYVFAVFFPAVTGFTAGVGMSGDLKNPRKSIPKGTLMAVLTGFVIYISIPFLLSFVKVPLNEISQEGVGVWNNIALFGAVLVVPGMWGAILSSAFGSVLTAPRVAQALSNDGIAPKFLSKLSKTGQPTVATWISGGIALLAVTLGDLNAVAQFVTILFLTLYVVINLCAVIEKLAGDPSYRPKINVPWYVSLLGSMGALAVMFLLNPLACVIAFTLEFILYFYLQNKALKRRWGDVRAGIWLSLSRFALLKLKTHKPDPRNWRPHIILFVGDIEKHVDLIYLADCFNQKRGILTVCSIFQGQIAKSNIDINSRLKSMNRIIDDNQFSAFCEVNVSPSFKNGVINIAQSSGIAGLHSNTIIFGWSMDKEKLISQLKIMRVLDKLNKNTIISRVDPINKDQLMKKIDIWWGGLQNNGDLMLLLSYLLRINPLWKKADIIVHSIVPDETEKEAIQSGLSKLFSNVRIEAKTEIFVQQKGESIDSIITRNSQDSDIVFFGLMIPKENEESEYADRLIGLSNNLKSIVFVRNASEFSGNLI